MDFATSSQRKRWLYSPDALAAERAKAREDFLSQFKATVPDLDNDPDLISLVEELGLLRHYQEKLIGVSANLKLPRKVLSTSINFLKRYYIKRSSLENDPQTMTLACLYLACKTEDCYLSAAELGRLVGMPADVLLKLELVLLQGLDFDLLVHSVYRALEGCMTDLQEWAESSNGNADIAQKISQIKGEAYQLADRLIQTDAPLLYTPGQVGLCALRSGVRKQVEKSSSSFEAYFEHVASKSGGPSSAEIVAELTAVLDKIEKVMEDAGEPLQVEDVAAIDRRLKSFRKKLPAGKKSKSSGGGGA